MEKGFLQAAAENLQFVAVCVLVIAVLIGAAALIEKKFLVQNIASVRRTRYLTLCAMLGALAMILHLFDFPVVFLAPGFYKLDFSEIPVMIGAFYLGPVAGVIIELVKILLKLVIKGTSTAFVGDLANFIVGCSFVVPAALIYKYHKNKKGALISMVAGSLSLMLIGSLLNYFVLIPAFSQFYNLPIENIVSMGAAVNPLVSDLKSLVVCAVAPFNLVKGIVCSFLAMLLYKRVSKILHI